MADESLDVASNLGRVKARITAATSRAGRDPAEVRLVAVSKGKSPQAIRRAYVAGLRDFGENRVEEVLPKLEALKDLQGICWHMIGHIQSRKARLIVPAFAWVHSVDRIRIARLLDREAGERGQRLPVLLECNVSGEATKDGWHLADRGAWEALASEIAQVADLPHLEVRGLMTMAPWSADPETARPVFRQLRALRDHLSGIVPGQWDELSMGMTDDFEVAVEEGATIVRIGRAIFGPRGGEA
jgi:hypothetical protein